VSYARPREIGYASVIWILSQPKYIITILVGILESFGLGSQGITKLASARG
jgi:hypothetical protein